MEPKKMLESSGLETKEMEQCEREAEALGFQIGLLSALRERGILSDEDCRAVHRSVQKAKELLLSLLRATIDFEEAAQLEDPDKALAAGAEMKHLTMELASMTSGLNEEDSQTMMAELDQVLDQIKKEAAE